MLAQRYPVEQVRNLLIPRPEWLPYPTIHERAPWEALPATLRHAYTTRAVELLSAEWPSLPATLFLQFARNGNRRNDEIAF